MNTSVHPSDIRICKHCGWVNRDHENLGPCDNCGHKVFIHIRKNHEHGELAWNWEAVEK